MTSVLLASRLSPPPLRPASHARMALVDRVRTDERQVVVVSAPAGYGKSTFLRQWAEQEGRAVAWVSLEATDDDDALVVDYIVAALERAGSLDAGVPEAGRRGSLSGEALTRLAAAVWGTVRPTVLMIDDVDQMRSPGTLDAMAWLAEHLPPAVRLAVASRARPPLPLARLRAHGRLLEVGTRDLAMSVAEASDLLGQSGVTLPREQAASIARRTEGWAAGIHLAAMSLRAGGGMHVVAPGQAIHRHPGDDATDRYAAEFLRTEILDRVSPSLRRFLLRTSPLDRFDASLADHVTQTTDSAETLAELERTNAFLVPLEGRSRWYRYHHLFRDLLVTELRRSEPSSEALVQRRAAQWFVTHDDPSAAIEYAHQAGDDDLVASLLVTSGMRQYRAGRLTTLDRWFGWFAVEGLAGSPALAILGAWIWALSGRTGRAERWEDALRPHVDALDPYLRAVYATLRSVTGRMSWDAQAAEARIAMDGLPDGDVWRASAFVGGGIHELLHGDLTAGDVLLARAVDIGVENHAIPATSAALGFRAQVAIARGDWDHAEELVRDAASLIADERLEHYATSAIAFATRARIAIHRGAHDAAQRDIALLQRLRPGLTAAIPYLAVRVRLELAQAYLELGEVAGARLMLSEATDVVAVRPGVAALADEVSALRARAGQPRGGIGVASLTTAELRLLGYMPSHLTFREIASRLFVSVNTVKTQAISTYTKLGVSSRSAAVDAAVEAGLLDRAITRFPVAGPDIDLDRLTHATTSRVAPAR